ncbi:late blight resistance protein R1-A-like [Coffea eugenioides]|uniref:late blight resistance protein R1-A-like n=1 Tax=Coffea eugenioides TaxID=49369 RepID=UPI000F606BE1|nr:late blight resistance protein R1-A-like [Coffea eugenioides]
MAISSFDIIVFFLDVVRRNNGMVGGIWRGNRGHWRQRYRILEDWKLLRLIWEAIHKLMRDEDAERMLLNMGFKIEAAAEEIGRHVVITNKNNTQIKFLSSVNAKTFYDYYYKTIEWIEEIGEDVEHLLDSSGWSSCRLQSPSDVSFWLQFVSTLADIVDDTKWSEPIGAWRKELRLFGEYMEGVSSDLDFPAAAAAAGGDDVNVINDFVTRVASVMVRIAIHTLRQRINDRKTAGTTRREEMKQVTKSVLALQHEIHPTNPKQEEEDQTIPNFLAEIHTVLIEREFLKQTERKGELRINVCLLQTELFLKGMLHCNIQGSTFRNKDLLKGMPEIWIRFLGNLLHGEAEYWNKALAFIKQADYTVASLRQLFEAKSITESTVRNSIFLLLLNIVVFKAEALFEKLQLESANSEGHRKDQIALLVLLNLFTLLSNQLKEETEDTDMIFPQTETFDAGMAGPIHNMIISSSKLQDKLNPIKSKLREISPQFPLFDFPKTYKTGFVEFLIRNLEELLNDDPVSIEPVRNYIKEIHLHFKSLGSFLMKVSESEIDDYPEVKVLGGHVANIAYKIEFVIDSIEVDPQWQGFFLVYDLLEELRIVNKRASRIQLTTPQAKVLDNKHVIQVPPNVISRDATPAINGMVVDPRDEEQSITDQLVKGSSKFGIVSLVGMPGIGKTTMAWKLFNCQKVLSHFHCRAWCTVSQEYDKRELLLEILRGILGLTDEIRQMTNEDLQLKLRQCLLRNRFLIVMDDVWDAGVWNELRNSFPDDANGSRILITSRLRDVALQIEPDSDPHSLRLFSDYESWTLLVEKVFHGEGCPEELSLVGKEIAKKCKGLPLAVVAISGLLQRIEESSESWGKIAKSLIAEVMEDPNARCMEILELSYKHLPGYLKPCFLYLGVFLEDKDIPVSKLIRFWLAEGFIHDSELKSLEGIAEGYLMELISRSLVEVSKRRSNGMVKSCRLHDLLRDFCQLKARAQNFFRLVTRFDEPYVSFPSSDFGFEIGHHSDPVTYEAYRLCFFLKRLHFFKSRPFGLGTRSLIFFPSADSEPRCPYDISFIWHNFKLLRVLDFECINLGVTFPADITCLVHLRYLAITGYMQTIPQSIGNLRKLETFVLKGLRGQVVLPDTIWHMTRLRHLHVNMHVAFTLDDEGLEVCCKLGDLVSLSCLSLSCSEDTESIIKRLPNLQKLRCIFFHPQGSSKNSYQFPSLDFLTHLVSLNVFYYGSAITREFVLPPNLRELTLSNFHLPWSHISTIGRLPNLEVLKLLLGAFEGLTWDMEEEHFKELKFLKLDNLNISQWNATCDHLPKLERLVLQNCKDLEEIPYDFADIGTLELVEVHWCGQSAEESAKRIGEATGDIKVLISSSYLR